jgi:hypothetical protein
VSIIAWHRPCACGAAFQAALQAENMHHSPRITPGD